MAALLKIVRFLNYIFGLFLTVGIILSILHFFGIFSPVAGIYHYTIGSLIGVIILTIIEAGLRRA